MNRHRSFSKSDHALRLFEKGVDTVAIAERLGTTVNSVSALLINARERRAREIERAGKLADIMGANV
jgi:transcriptional regulator